MNIEIITTPNDELKESGFGSLKSCNNVLESIINMGHNVVLTTCTTKYDLEKVVIRNPDLVLLAVKYVSFENENDIWLSDYFSKHSINYSASSREVLRFDSDKVLAKLHLKESGIKTANYFTAIPGQYKCAKELPIVFPLFLKPIDAANGNGIDDLSFVTNFIDFESKVLSLHDTFKLPILVEEYLNGKEFTVAVIEKTNGELIVSPIEIIPLVSTNGLRILGQQAKKDDTEELKKIVDNDMKIKLIKLATDVFNGLGIRDYGRIDIKTNKAGECFFMEANLVPGMTQGSSYFPKACEIENELTYDKVIELMLSKGLDRIPYALPSTLNSLLNHDETLPALQPILEPLNHQGFLQHEGV
ncbi:MAG: D-alanine--D-alanine ligase [Sulfurovum sp.]|jgi:D-alanine-D-alanine ligase|uniref:D-alanine--D-alanine ligase n=1 Tax=Sulfurovum sp. TaxID=1969726 RepID=UPI003C75C077